MAIFVGLRIREVKQKERQGYVDEARSEGMGRTDCDSDV